MGTKKKQLTEEEINAEFKYRHDRALHNMDAARSFAIELFHGESLTGEDITGVYDLLYGGTDDAGAWLGHDADEEAKEHLIMAKKDADEQRVRWFGAGAGPAKPEAVLALYERAFVDVLDE